MREEDERPPNKKSHAYRENLLCIVIPFNSLKPNGDSHSYQLDQFISNLRVVGCNFAPLVFKL